MNTLNEYDVDDDLPRNNNGNGPKPPKLILNESSKNLNERKKGRNEGEEEKETNPVKKPRPKLDFNRLLKGKRGLGYLAISAPKHLQLSGRPGSEAQDLSQISVFLQEWAKLVFPKMPLVEFLMKVESICQSPLMRVTRTRTRTRF